MNIVSTVSFKRRLYRLLGWFLTGFVLLMAGVAAYAKPPQRLMAHVGQFPIVFDKKCNVASLGVRDMECLIMLDKPRNVVYILLYNDAMDIVRVVVGYKGKEHSLWCSPLVCV